MQLEQFIALLFHVVVTVPILPISTRVIDAFQGQGRFISILNGSHMRIGAELAGAAGACAPPLLGSPRNFIV